MAVLLTLLLYRYKAQGGAWCKRAVSRGKTADKGETRTRADSYEAGGNYLLARRRVTSRARQTVKGRSKYARSFRKLGVVGCIATVSRRPK